MGAPDPAATPAPPSAPEGAPPAPPADDTAAPEVAAVEARPVRPLPDSGGSLVARVLVILAPAVLAAAALRPRGRAGAARR